MNFGDSFRRFAHTFLSPTADRAPGIAMTITSSSTTAPVVGGTGDLRNLLLQLFSELRSAKYRGSLDPQDLCAGVAAAYLPLLHHALLDAWPRVGAWLCSRGHDLRGKRDARFLQGVYRALRDEWAYKPALTRPQFLAPGFAARKLMLVLDLLRLSRERDADLARREGNGSGAASASRSVESVAPTSSSGTGWAPTRVDRATASPTDVPKWGSAAGPVGGNTGGAAATNLHPPPADFSFTVPLPVPPPAPSSPPRKPERPATRLSSSSAGTDHHRPEASTDEHEQMRERLAALRLGHSPERTTRPGQTAAPAPHQEARSIEDSGSTGPARPSSSAIRGNPLYAHVKDFESAAPEEAEALKVQATLVAIRETMHTVDSTLRRMQTRMDALEHQMDDVRKAQGFRDAEFEKLIKANEALRDENARLRAKLDQQQNGSGKRYEDVSQKHSEGHSYLPASPRAVPDLLNQTQARPFSFRPPSTSPKRSAAWSTKTPAPVTPVLPPAPALAAAGWGASPTAPGPAYTTAQRPGSPGVLAMQAQMQEARALRSQIAQRLRATQSLIQGLTSASASPASIDRGAGRLHEGMAGSPTPLNIGDR